VDEILRKMPRPNYSELSELYEELDREARRIGEVLMKSKLFDRTNLVMKFDEADVNIISELILKDPEVMIPFFVVVCGFSDRELARLYGIRNVYSLKKVPKPDKFRAFVNAVVGQLRHPLGLETLLFKFYKNWEEHQKRHYRARLAEETVIGFLKSRGYAAGKIKVAYGDKEREVDCAIPPDPESPRVIMQIRRGVLKDLVKRAKEYSSEFDEVMQHFPQAKFVVIYLVSSHERDRINEARSRITGEREGKRPYDLVVLTREELETLVKKLEEWGVPRLHK
jgi:hypothetical protein